MNDVDNLLGSYRRILLSANKKLNLVSRSSVDKLLPSLIQESLIPLSWRGCSVASPLLDVGTGGGLPGIPLKISRPELSVVLLDSNRKKVLFLKSAIRELSLTNTEAIWMRCEEFADLQENQCMFATVTARGVGDFDLLIKSAAKLLKPMGELIVWLSDVPLKRDDLWQYFEEPKRLEAGEGLILLNFRRNELPVN